jgi:low affinity Fe/Cu permease
MATSDRSIFEKFSNWATKFTGSSYAFLGAVAIVVIWAVSGPVFNYSETWQLVINTGTTIITMTFSKRSMMNG